MELDGGFVWVFGKVVAEVESDGVHSNFILIKPLNDQRQVISPCQFRLAIRDQEDSLRILSFSASLRNHVTSNQKPVNPVRLGGLLCPDLLYLFEEFNLDSLELSVGGDVEIAAPVLVVQLVLGCGGAD